MSGWIKVEKSLERDPRVLRIAKRLRNADVTPEYARLVALGALVQLWLYADTHIRPDDTLEMGASDIDDMVGLPGFAAALPEDWLKVIDEETVELPDFQKHNGVAAKRRAQTAKRVARHRNAGVTKTALPDQDQDQDQDHTTPPSGAPKKKATRKRGSRRCPDDFEVTDEMRDWAKKEHPEVNIETETAMFRDHEFAKPKTDWVGTWKNWIRRASNIREAARNVGRGNSRRGSSVAESFDDKDYQGTPDEELPSWARGLGRDG